VGKLTHVTVSKQDQQAKPSAAIALPRWLETPQQPRWRVTPQTPSVASIPAPNPWSA